MDYFKLTRMITKFVGAWAFLFGLVELSSGFFSPEPNFLIGVLLLTIGAGLWFSDKFYEKYFNN